MPEFLVVILPAAPEVLLFLGTLLIYSFSLLLGRVWLRGADHPWLRNGIYSLLWFFVVVLTIYDPNDGLNLFGAHEDLDPLFRETTFSGMLSLDVFSKTSKMVMSLWVLSFLVLCFRFQPFALNHEKFVGISAAILGSFLSFSANDFRLFFLALELASTAILFLISQITRRSVVLQTYVIVGIGSALIILGASFLYAATGTTDFALWSKMLIHPGGSHPLGPLVHVGLTLIILGLCCKTLLFPFHKQIVDVATQVESPLVFFLNFITRYVGLLLIVKLLLLFEKNYLGLFLVLLGAVSMVVGWVGALKQPNLVASLVDYSIGDMGAFLLGIAVAGSEALPSIFLIFLSTTLSLLVLQGILMYARHEGCRIRLWTDLAIASHCFRGVPLLLCSGFLSLVGFPPFPGMMGFLAFTQNLLAHDAYWILTFVVLAKMLSMGVGLKAVHIFVTSRRRLERFGKSSSSFPWLPVGLTAVMFSFALRTDSVLNFLSLAETSIRSYGS